MNRPSTTEPTVHEPIVWDAWAWARDARDIQREHRYDHPQERVTWTLWIRPESRRRTESMIAMGVLHV